jgi:hypothetical protein
MAQVNPKHVQQAVKVGVALANPGVEEKDLANLKSRFQLNDPATDGLRKLFELVETSPEVKLVLQCLTFGT